MGSRMGFTPLLVMMHYLIIARNTVHGNFCMLHMAQHGISRTPKFAYASEISAKLCLSAIHQQRQLQQLQLR